MNSAETYAYLTNFNSVASIILKLSLICIIIYSIINFFSNRGKNKEKSLVIENNNIGIRKKLTIIDFFGAVTLMGLAIIFSLYLIKINKLISFLSIPSTILIIYIVYIKPMIKVDKKAFNYNYAMYGLVLIGALWINSKIDYLEYFQQLESESASQVIVIILVLLQMYTTFYCLVLNSYFLLKSITSLDIGKIDNYFSNMVKKLDKNFSYDNISLNYNFSNQIYKSDNKNLKKILLIIPYFVLDTIICLLLYLFSVVLTIFINPILVFIKSIFKLLIKISMTNENEINYGITKITLIVSFVFTYLLIQANDNIFQERIVSTYDFISTAILIPLILDSLLSMKEKFKKI